MGDKELELVKEAFASNWIAPLGPHVDAFEKEFADYVGTSHAAALSSGTAAIRLALRLLGVHPGAEVICSTMTFVASANPIVYEGGTPVFIDSEPGSWNLDPALLREELDTCAARGCLQRARLFRQRRADFRKANRRWWSGDGNTPRSLTIFHDHSRSGDAGLGGFRARERR